jgi:putative transcriptional regulator
MKVGSSTIRPGRAGETGRSNSAIDLSDNRTENRHVRALTPAVVAAGLAMASLLVARPSAQDARLHERLYREAVKSLAAGKLLVAARRLPDPNFSRTVVLLAVHGDEGAMGLIVNRRSEVPLARLFPQVMPTMSTAGHAFAGGPVQREVAIALVRTSESPAGARPIMNGVHVVSAREPLEALLASGTPASRLRIYLGYAGWGPGQLEAETAQGSWHVLDGDADIVFDPDPAAVWPRQIARTEVISARAAGVAAETALHVARMRQPPAARQRRSRAPARRSRQTRGSGSRRSPARGPWPRAGRRPGTRAAARSGSSPVRACRTG